MSDFESTSPPGHDHGPDQQEEAPAALADAIADRVRDAVSREAADRNAELSGLVSEAEQRRLADGVEYAAGSVVSRTVTEDERRTVTLFAFDRGQALSEHSAPFDAFVGVLEGEAELVIGGEAVRATPGGFVTMPANVPHAVRAVEPFKMVLVMLRAGES